MSVNNGILITGFEPFGGASVNPTELVVKELQHHLAIQQSSAHEDRQRPVLFHTLVLPVSSEASDMVNSLLDTTTLSHILHLGLHEKISDIAIERVGLNLDDYRIPDNTGEQIRDRAIEASGDTAYLATLPVRLIEDVFNNRGISCHLSYSAGTYLCNHLLYTTLHHIHSRRYSIKAGFLHIPPLEVMDLGSIGEALRIVLEILGYSPPPSFFPHPEADSSDPDTML